MLKNQSFVTEMSLYDEYDQELKYRRVKVNEERWTHALNFRKCTMEHGRWQGTTVFHSLRKLSDSFFRYEKKRYISRPNFILCLNQNNIPIDGSHAYSIYDSFDSLQKNEFDWRIFVFMLFVTFQCVQKDVKFLLRYAFRFYVGHICDIDSPCNSEVQLRNLGSVLDMLIRPDRVDAMIVCFDEEWRRSTGVMGKSAHITCSISFKITYDTFSRMLEKIAIFNVQESDDTYLKRFEQEYYSSALYKHRRCLRYMDYFIVLNLSKIKRDTLSQWRNIVKLRKRARWLCNSINRRISIAMLKHALEKLWYNIIIHVASIVIQCAYRVSSAKSKITQKRTIMLSATIIQKRYKGYSARVIFANRRANRINAVICMQRCIRGRIGRHLAHQRRLTLIDKKRLEMFKEAELNYFIQIEQCAITIQRRFRNKSAQQRFYDIVEKKRRELRVISEMNSLLIEKEKEKMIQKRQSQIFAKNVFDQKRNQLMVQRKTKIDKDRLQALHLKMKDKQKLEMESLRYKQNFEFIKRMKEKLKKEYCEKADQDCQTLKKQYSLCLRSPENTSERKKNREMRKRINER